MMAYHTATVLFVASRLLSELDNLSQGNVRGRSPKVHNRSVLFIQHTHTYSGILFDLLTLITSLRSTQKIHKLAKQPRHFETVHRCFVFVITRIIKLFTYICFINNVLPTFTLTHRRVRHQRFSLLLPLSPF
jgi:hypothetical protein